ncbi:MAG TPA: ABC transporter ATP-binding protein, partial [Bacillota bacterium]|nr:ABC transporter ATP-binding protein [Bacillota bacterium]
MTPVIRLTDVAVEFRRTTLLTEVNLSVEEGDCCAIVGPNGSGKTVLLKIMCGFLAPTRGTVSISPEYLSRRRTFPERFGIILDRPGFLAGQSGMDNLRALAAIRGVIGDDEIVAALDAVDLDPTLRQPVGRYSMGMKQKLALAQAIMEDQTVLILDEPFNALDEDSVEIVREVLSDRLEAGCTLVFTSHQQADLDALDPR